MNNFKNSIGNVSTGIVSRSRMAAPVNMRIAPSSRSVSAFAHSNEKQIAVRPRPGTVEFLENFCDEIVLTNFIFS